MTLFFWICFILYFFQVVGWFWFWERERFSYRHTFVDVTSVNFNSKKVYEDEIFGQQVIFLRRIERLQICKISTDVSGTLTSTAWSLRINTSPYWLIPYCQDHILIYFPAMTALSANKKLVTNKFVVYCSHFIFESILINQKVQSSAKTYCDKALWHICTSILYIVLHLKVIMKRKLKKTFKKKKKERLK